MNFYSICDFYFLRAPKVREKNLPPSVQDFFDFCGHHCSIYIYYFLTFSTWFFFEIWRSFKTVHLNWKITLAGFLQALAMVIINKLSISTFFYLSFFCNLTFFTWHFCNITNFNITFLQFFVFYMTFLQYDNFLLDIILQSNIFYLTFLQYDNFLIDFLQYDNFYLTFLQYHKF